MLFFGSDMLGHLPALGAQCQPQPVTSTRRVSLTYMNGGRPKGYPPFLIRKMLSKRLYVTSMMPPQTKTANCCCFGSTIRGALTASEMAAKDKTPSRMQISKEWALGLDTQNEHTQGRDYLSFEAKLVLEATSKVGDAAPPISGHVGHFPDLVEHVAAGE